MKGSEKFKTRIENFLKEKSISEASFSKMFAKASKNLENCLKYIISEVKKTGECAFDDSEIFDMAVKYYTDDTIGSLPDIKCRVTVNEPQTADLFSAPVPLEENAVKITAQSAQPVVPLLVKQAPKTAQTTLTLFDL